MHTTTAFLLPTAPAAGSENAGMLSRQRQPVAPMEAKRGGKGYGSSGGAGGGSAGPTAVDGRSLRGFSKVLADGGESKSVCLCVGLLLLLVALARRRWQSLTHPPTRTYPIYPM